MKLNRLSRAAAITATSAALVFSGAGLAVAAESPGTATATESATSDSASGTPATYPGTPSSQGKLSASSVRPASVTSFAFKSGILYTSGANFVRGSFAFNDTDVVGAYTQVRVNGKYRGNATLKYSNGVDLSGKFGPGIVQLGPTTFQVEGGGFRVDRHMSNKFYFRRDTYGAFRVVHRGKKVTFSIKALNRNGSTGGSDSAKIAYVQYYKKGHWKVLKKVRLYRNGTRKFSYHTGKRRYYRLLVKPNSATQGMAIKLRKL